MHTENLWIFWLGAPQSIGYGLYGLQCRKNLRPQHGSTVRHFFLVIICLIIPSLAMIVISCWKNFVSFTNAEFSMETFGLPT